MKTWKTIRNAAAVALLCLAGAASADTISGQVVGWVVDAQTGRPIAGARVTASSPAWIDQTVTTNASGYYVLAMLPPATYTITARAPGYGEMQPTDVRVMLDWRSRNDFKLATGTARKDVPATAVAQNR
jgi:hypothetical protein